MKNRTLTVTVAADRDAIFSFLSAVGNWPQWAPMLCTDLRREGARWCATTPGGTDFVTLLADDRTGVIDFALGALPDQMASLALRVLSTPQGTAVLCTLFPPAGWADELFERYYDALLAGFRGLVGRFAGGEVFGDAWLAEPFFPSLVTARFYDTWDFYTTHLGFRTVCESDTYVHLVHPCGAQIGVLRAELDGPPAELVPATNGRGFWLTLNVSDADAEHARLAAGEVEIVEPVEDKPWGHRQFVLRDPNGVLIAVAHRLAPTGERLSALPAAS